MKQPAVSSFFGALLLIVSLNLQIQSQWVQQVSGTNYDLYAVYFINNSTGFISTSKPGIPPPPYGGEVLRTSNGGDNWQRVLFDTTFRAKGFYFFDGNTGFVVGGYYSVTGRIFKTTNSGLNWFDVTPQPFLDTYLWNIMFFNSNTGYAGGTYGVIKTTNGGNNWERILTTQTIEAGSWGKIYFTDVNTGFFTSDSGRVFKTVNGGLNWSVSRITSIALRDIKFVNSNTGYIVGNNGIIFKTTDQGNNWNILNSTTAQNLFSVFFTDLNNGYVTTEHTVLKTTNAGSNWFPVFGLQADSLFGSYFLDANTGYVCGDEGRIYKTTTGGVLGIPPVSTEVPQNFMLYQNYPNPFNPTTNIKFAIPKAAFVKLAVYDILGREVEALVNENLSPATYEVKWDASGFSSGVYFYKMSAGDFTHVKKLSVIK